MLDPVRVARGLLGGGAVLFLVVYAIPLVVAPLRWARWFRWRIPEGDTRLVVYLGRCVGGLTLAVVIMALTALPDPRGHLAVFELVAWACGLMALVHAWGAVRRTQPWTEDLEVVLFAAVCAIATWLRFALR